jgi:hypothetical protein
MLSTHSSYPVCGFACSSTTPRLLSVHTLPFLILTDLFRFFKKKFIHANTNTNSHLKKQPCVEVKKALKLLHIVQCHYNLHSNKSQKKAIKSRF